MQLFLDELSIHLVFFQPVNMYINYRQLMATKKSDKITSLLLF